MDRKKYGQIKSPLKAIKVFCVEECNSGNYSYAKTCVDLKCPLYAFRLGKNPYRVCNLSEEQRAAAGERLRMSKLKH